MATLIRNLTDQYNDFLRTNKHPVIDTWPMMKGPVPLLIIVSCYLYFILKLGPQFMASRKPFSLQRLLVIYNFLMVVWSLILTVWTITHGPIIPVVLNGCHPKERLNEEIMYSASSCAWWYFISKVVELADTVFFVLRKKQRQITFLHVYHHAATAFYVWIHLKYLPGPQGIIPEFLNSVVHIFMYFYYMVAAMGPSYQKYIWWKKYMTWIQLIQFAIMLSYMIGSLALNCEQPKGVSIYFILVSGVYMILFLDFYSKAYKKKRED